MKKKLTGKIMLGVAAVLLIVGIVFCTLGFSKKNDYFFFNESSPLNKNAYVGGDAYNYIINGTYFTGYCALGGSLFVCSAVLSGFGLYFVFREDSEKDSPNNKANQSLPPL